MATRNWTVATLQTFGDNVRVISWAGLLQSSSDVGQPFEMPGWNDRSVQLLGTLGTGGEITIEGTNEAIPVTWSPLTDPQGNPIELAAIGALEAVAELTRWIRPRVSGGNGTTNLSIALLMRRL